MSEDSIGQLFKDAAENTALAVGHVAKGSTQLLKTATDKGLQLTDNTLKESINTIDIAQSAVNDGIQNLVKTGKKGIQHTANITMKGAETAEEVAKNGLEVVNVASNTSSAVASQGLETTKEVATSGLYQLGELTKHSVELAGNSLVAFISTAGNAAKRKIAKTKASSEADTTREPELVYTELKDKELKDFTKKIDEFTREYKSMISNQEKLLKSLLNIYKLKKCKKGTLYGYTCSKDIMDKTKVFEDQLKSLHEKSASQIKKLETIKQKARSEILKINSSGITPQEYQAQLAQQSFKCSLEASNIFNSTLERFEKFATELEKAEEDALEVVEELVVQEEVVKAEPSATKEVVKEPELEVVEEPEGEGEEERVFANTTIPAAAAAAAGGKRKTRNKKSKKISKKSRKSRKSRKSKKSKKSRKSKKCRKH